MTVVAFDHKSRGNKNGSVQQRESCPKTRDMGLIRPWVSISEERPDILKHGVHDGVRESHTCNCVYKQTTRGLMLTQML